MGPATLRHRRPAGLLVPAFLTPLLCLALTPLSPATPVGATNARAAEFGAPGAPGALGAAGAPGRAEGTLVLETLAGNFETRPADAPGEIRFAKDGVAFLRHEGPRPDPVASPARLELIDGQRWIGDVLGGKDDDLRFRSSLAVEFSVSVDHVARLEFPGRLPGADRAAVSGAPSGDRLYWIRGDKLERVDGSFESFAAEGVVLSGVLGKRTFPWAEIGALFLAPLEDSAPIARPSGTPLVLDLDDGSRITGAFLGVAARKLRLSASGAGELEVPFARLVEAALDDGSFVHLSALAPDRAKEGSVFGDEFGLAWPHRVDRSVTGTPLSVSGRSFARGLGVHAPSRLEWSLEPRADSPLGPRAVRELAGEVGVDDSARATRARGSVRFQVLVDDAVRWDSGIVRGGDSPQPMPRIDLRGAKRLALVVDAADESFVADRADWLRPILIRD